MKRYDVPNVVRDAVHLISARIASRLIKQPQVRDKHEVLLVVDEATALTPTLLLTHPLHHRDASRISDFAYNAICFCLGSLGARTMISRIVNGADVEGLAVAGAPRISQRELPMWKDWTILLPRHRDVLALMSFLSPCNHRLQHVASVAVERTAFERFHNVLQKEVHTVRHSINRCQFKIERDFFSRYRRFLIGHAQMQREQQLHLQEIRW